MVAIVRDETEQPARERRFPGVVPTLALKFPSRYLPPSLRGGVPSWKIRGKGGGGDKKKEERREGECEVIDEAAGRGGLGEGCRGSWVAAVPSERDPASDKFAQRARVRRKRKQTRFRGGREREASTLSRVRSKGEEEAKGRAAEMVAGGGWSAGRGGTKG